MSDDYLCDGSGAPDPDVERLERMLGRLRSTASVPPITSNAERPNVERRTANDEPRTTNHERRSTQRPISGVRFLGPALAAAAAIVLMVGAHLEERGAAAATACDAGRAHGRCRC